MLQQPYDVEVGAGTMAPETFLRVLGPKPYKVAYVQPSRRPADGRYGDNPNRLYKHLQLQVILKPPPENVQELYLESLDAIGIDLRKHDLKFEEDNWEAPTLAAWGVGWQVMLDGLEITQFTYFQQCGGIDLDPISAELTYGLERIAAFLQDVDSIYDIVWARDPETGEVVTYHDVRFQDEYQFSVYNFELADATGLWKSLEQYEKECQALLQLEFMYTASASSIRWYVKPFILGTDAGYTLIENPEQRVSEAAGLKAGEAYFFHPYFNLERRSVEFLLTEKSDPTYIPLTYTPLRVFTTTTGAGGGGSKCLNRFGMPRPAFDLCLKCSHIFNLLDARGAISVTERVGVIFRIRNLAVLVAEAYVESQSVATLEGKEASGNG